MPARKIMLIRHGEKPGGSPAAAGVDPDGQQNPEDLSVQGWQRAGALGRLFNPWQSPQRAGLAVPAVLFASGVGKHSHSLRPQHTLLPLSQLLNLDIDLSCAKGQISELAAAAAHAQGPVLIAWEHQDIPAIVNALVGNAGSCPQSWPGERFDLVWVLDEDVQSGGWRFSQVPQMLLAGDVPEPIAMPA